MLIAPVAMGMHGCAPSDSDTAEARPEQAGQPVNPVKMARHITGTRASAAPGDSKTAEAHVRAMTDDVIRSARVYDTSRPIDHEAARTAVRPLPGVRSSVWMDRENFIVMVNGASYHSMKMIDKVCLALQPLGDTLAIVVNVQDVTATTPDGATTLSRNCQLPEGQRAFMQRKREVDVVSKELRDTFREQQGE
ncbi:MAG TPA: hypothetical protein VFN25_07555 [Dokdonella sp.]|uniref:hypothetical protein n=1 Tax=Dokdonella sp. TaxID=2291710 RepID=UPI002D7FB43B|nr:hypothetical protein [Dokdonella sp.]HET9032744.1 hypothetical protein [Dokdonella sp.]